MIVDLPATAPGPAAVEAHELYRFFHAGDDETFALRGVSLAAHSGEIVAVVGPSGSGKSTLLACLAGLDEPDGGYVSVAGHRISRRPEATRARLRAHRVGVLSQSGNLLEHLNVAQNVRAAQALVGRARSDRLRAVDGLLASVGLQERASARPSTLSGGEAARAGLAVALANDPPVLLADEPTGEVDVANAALILDLLRRRADAGGAVVVVTHSDRVASAADRVVRLVDGRVVDAA
jgi:putative ABC transport system ATP-binding protein